MILFEEVQGSSRKVQEVFQGITIIFLIVLVLNLFLQDFSINDKTLVLFAGFLVCLLVSIWVRIRLVLQIRADGVYIRYFPFQPSFMVIAWNDIEKVFIRDFNGLMEYNGWGVKQGTSGESFTVHGNSVGLQIVKRDGRHLLVGTRKPEEIEEILRKLEAKRGV